MKYKFTISFISIFLLIGILKSFGQIQFQITIGSTQYEYANTIIQTTDGGYTVSGSFQRPTGYYDMYIVKLDSSGTLQWSRTIGETNEEHGNVIIRTTDGGYAVAGGTTSFGAGNYDMCIVKLDASGTLQWCRTIGGSSFDEGYSIVQTTDGGYVVAGETNSFGAGGFDIYIVKLDALGTLQWSRTIGGSSLDAPRSIIQTTDGGYMIAGQTASFGAGDYDMYIVKLNASGTLQWSRTIGATSSYETARSIIQTTDGGYVVAGETNSFGAGGYDMYIVKLDGSGTIQWTKTIGGTGNDYCYSIKQTTDGGYAAAGTTYSFGSSGGDMYIVKLNSEGTIQWSRTIGGLSLDEALSIIQTIDGSYCVAGYTFSYGASSGDMYIVKFNSSGYTCGNNTNPASQSGTGGTINSQASIVTNPTSSVTSPTPATSASGTVTIICITAIQPVSNQIPISFELYQNYPNPFNPTTRIKFDIPLSPLSERGAGGFTIIKIFDLLGREVSILVNHHLSPGTYEVEWDASNYPSGVYFYKLIADGVSITKKMVLLK